MHSSLQNWNSSIPHHKKKIAFVRLFSSLKKNCIWSHLWSIFKNTGSFPNEINGQASKYLIFWSNFVSSCRSTIQIWCGLVTSIKETDLKVFIAKVNFVSFSVIDAANWICETIEGNIVWKINDTKMYNISKDASLHLHNYSDICLQILIH